MAPGFEDETDLMVSSILARFTERVEEQVQQVMEIMDEIANIRMTTEQLANESYNTLPMEARAFVNVSRIERILALISQCGMTALQHYYLLTDAQNTLIRLSQHPINPLFQLVEYGNERAYLTRLEADLNGIHRHVDDSRELLDDSRGLAQLVHDSLIRF